MCLSDGDAFCTVAMHGVPTAYAEERRRNPVIPTIPGTTLGRISETRQTVQIADIQAEPAYWNNPLTRAGIIGAAGGRTVVGVPLLKDRELLGAILIWRQEVRPFTEKQIALVTNFASQAVIAIENTRLLNELRQRTDDLTESLEQQTATSKVLEVISRSAFDLQAVFETVAESSVKLCGADRSFIFRFDGELLRLVVGFNVSQEFKEFIERNPIRLAVTAQAPERLSNAERSISLMCKLIRNSPMRKTLRSSEQYSRYRSSKAMIFLA
jgi:transcriptional regulator with GAF, ATPase, and Fis domain